MINRPLPICQVEFFCSARVRERDTLHKAHVFLIFILYQSEFLPKVTSDRYQPKKYFIYYFLFIIIG